MKASDKIADKVIDLEEMKRKVNQWRVLEKKIVFTNGCFDILHKGHIFSLTEAAREGDVLVVGLNSDLSTRKLKGEGRPVNDQEARALVLASLIMVDAVIIFNEDTPEQLIAELQPDVLVKGGDYDPDKIAGATTVKNRGGRIVINKILEGYSTTAIVHQLQNK